MITNEQVQGLIKTDRDALVALLAFAYAVGAQRYGGDLWNDPDARRLVEDARREASGPVRGGLSLDKWNTEMGAV